MSNKKQTAIEWLVDEIAEKYNFRFATYYGQHIQEALEMEKEQIVDAHIEGQRLFDQHDHTQWTTEQAEQYYKKTYEQ